MHHIKKSPLAKLWSGLGCAGDKLRATHRLPAPPPTARAGIAAARSGLHVSHQPTIDDHSKYLTIATDHGTNPTMETMSISKFKATCLSVLERVRQTREPVLVTKRGVPIAEIKPPAEIEAGAWLGSMSGTMEIVGDIVAPAEREDAWEALT